MQDQRTHDQGVAPFEYASLQRLRLAQYRYLIRCQTPLDVTACDELERPIGFPAGIEMQPHRNQLREHRCRRLDKQTALFFRPAFQIRMVDALRDRNAEILVNRHQPVTRLRFLEIGALDSNVIARHQARDGRVPVQTRDEFPAPVLAQQTTRAGRVFGQRGNAGQGLIAPGFAKDAWYCRETAQCEHAFDA